jgi:cell division protein ZipA
LEPGVFKLETMEGLNTPGLILFFTLPGPDRPLVAYDQMIHTARRLTERLGGVL